MDSAISTLPPLPPSHMPYATVKHQQEEDDDDTHSYHDHNTAEDMDQHTVSASTTSTTTLKASTAMASASMTTTTTTTASASMRASPLLSAYTRIRKSMSEGSMASAKLNGPPSHITNDVRRRLRHQQHHPYPFMPSSSSSSKGPTGAGASHADAGMDDDDGSATSCSYSSMSTSKSSFSSLPLTIGMGMLKKTSVAKKKKGGKGRGDRWHHYPSSSSSGDAMNRLHHVSARMKEEGKEEDEEEEEEQMDENNEEDEEEDDEEEDGLNIDNEGEEEEEEQQQHSSSSTTTTTASTTSSSKKQETDRKAGGFENLGIYSQTTARLVASVSARITARASSRRAHSLGEIDLSRPPFKMSSALLQHIIEPEERYSLSGRVSGVCTAQGLKPSHPDWINQDNFILLDAKQQQQQQQQQQLSTSMSSSPISIYAVLDGHGEQGHLVSQHVRQHLPHYLAQTNFDPLLAFRLMQRDLVQCPFFDVACSGSTCVMVLARIMEEGGEGEGGREGGMALTIANLGDSRCVLGRRRVQRRRQRRVQDEEQEEELLDGSLFRRYLQPSSSSSNHHSNNSSSSSSSASRMYAIPLTRDHKPDRPDELRRITAAGGQVGYRQYISYPPSSHHHRSSTHPRPAPSITLGPARIWYEWRGDRNGLAMSRSLGDHAVHAAGGTSEPEVVEHRVREGGREGEGEGEEDVFLILASDGLWDVVENQDAVEVVEQFVSSSRRGRGEGGKGGEWDAKEAAAALVQFARNRWERLSPQVIDDITCMVVKLPMKGKKEEEERRQKVGGGRGGGGGGGGEVPLFFPPPQRRMA